MDDSLPADLASLARELARAARRETLRRFRSGAIAENKSRDGAFDPVTEADRAAEAAMRALIGQRFPDHAIAGEEFADTPGRSRYSWSLDPIDGTRSYICGLPTWVTLIAVLDCAEPLIGLIDAPCLDELYVGSAGGSVLERGGATMKLQTSDCTALREARLSTTDPSLFIGSADEAFAKLRSAARTVRYGHDGYAYARLAAGSLDLVVECGLKPHDYQAIVPVVRGADGTVGNWSGGSDLAQGNIIAAATPALYEAAVAIMREAA